MHTIYTSPERHYRQHEATRLDEQKFQIVVEESDLWITLPASVPLALARDTALQSVRDLRAAISAWMHIYPDFKHSLTPLPSECAPPERAAAVVKAMDRASRLVGVGPFAAVAGAVAQGVAERLLCLLREHHLPPEIIVENGGDTYLYSQRERVVALLPMPNSPDTPGTEDSERIGLRLGPEDFPLSLCASSATIGHSLSFGHGDLALTRARDAALADAAATAYGNMLKGAYSVGLAVQQAGHDAAYGLEGLFVQCEGKIGLWGKLELTALKLG